MTKINIKRTLLILVLFLSASAPPCLAQETKDTLNILFVGNSYTYFNNLPQLVSIISDNTKTKLVTKKSTIGGARLSEHWLGERNLNTKEMIRDGEFDIVVLQEYSMGAIDEPENTQKYLKLFSDYIKENNAKPYFYLTWAREKAPQYQDTINKVFMEAATENKAVAVPAGKVWARAKELRSTIKLYDSDGSHPSELGTFLSAFVFVASLTNEIPNQLDGYYQTTDTHGESVELMRIDTPDLMFCKKLAEEIILE